MARGDKQDHEFATAIGNHMSLQSVESLHRIFTSLDKFLKSFMPNGQRVNKSYALKLTLTAVKVSTSWNENQLRQFHKTIIAHSMRERFS